MSSSSARRQQRRHPAVHSRTPPRQRGDRGWDDVVTIASPAWFDRYVVAVAGVPTAPRAPHSPDKSHPGTAPEWTWPRSGAQHRLDYRPARRTRHQSPDDRRADQFKTDRRVVVRCGLRLWGGCPGAREVPADAGHQSSTGSHATAHAPAGGRDDVVGYGVVDPLAALTWDVPPLGSACCAGTHRGTAARRRARATATGSLTGARAGRPDRGRGGHCRSGAVGHDCLAKEAKPMRDRTFGTRTGLRAAAVAPKPHRGARTAISAATAGPWWAGAAGGAAVVCCCSWCASND